MASLHLHIVMLVGCAVSAVSSCSMTDETCEFWLEIHLRMTMMKDSVAVFPANGNLFRYDVTNVSTAEPINASDVISADGWEKPRLVISVNNTMPGPPIEVYEGQTVIIHVSNMLPSETVTVHWHGIHQQDTPWMDGVAFITQCPILPGNRFTYKFKAYPRGTFWYHSHVGSQISMGLLGAFIVKERKTPTVEEFIMMIQDWNHDYDGDMIHQKMLYGNYENRTKLKPTGSLEGALFSMFQFHSGLINGRGRFYDSTGQHNQAPLTVFTVQPSKTYRFRVIGAGSLYPFRVSVDQHQMTIVATDGNPIQPVLADSFIINPGERYDFEITTNMSIENYWITAQTLEVNVANHIAEAILRYDGAPDSEPTTQRKTCTSANRCHVVNCPFSFYPEGQFTDCTHLGELRAIKDNSSDAGASKNNISDFGASKDPSEPIEDIFLNFVFPGTIWTPAAVNGRTFKTPKVSALTQPQETDTFCDPNECGEDQVCKCTYSVDLEHDKVYQLVFLNLGAGKGWGHPIHLHGHYFSVVKMGYPEYDKTTGRVLRDNLDIDCHGNPNRSLSFCNYASWANSSWGGNNVPGLELELPIEKDTIIVPTGGYTVVRIVANNPGVWFIHCHIELHSGDGMAFMFNESFSKQLPAPAGFPRCGDFSSAPEQQTMESESDKQDGIYTMELFWIVVGCLIAINLICFVIICCLCWRFRLYKKPTLNVVGGHYNLTYSEQ